MADMCVEISLANLNFTGISEAFGQLPDFTIPEMPIVPDPLWGDQLDPLADKKEKLSSIITSAIMKYFKLFILDPIGEIVNLFKDIVAAVVGIWDEIMNFEIPGLGVTFTDLLNDLATQADQAIKNIITKVQPYIDMIVPIQIPNPCTLDAKNLVWEAVAKVQAAIKESLLAVMKKCMDIMKLVIDKVKQAFDLMGLALGPYIDQFFEMIENIPALVNEGITALMAMFNASIASAVKAVDDAKAAAESAIKDAEAAVDGAVDAAMKKANEAIALAKTTIEQFIKDITTVFGISIPGVPDLKETLSEKASNFWKEFLVLMQNWWASFTSSVITIFTDAMNEFLDLVNQFLDYVDSLVGAAKTAFIEAVNAISAGLMGAIANLPAQLASLIEGKVTFCVGLPEVPTVPAIPQV